MDKIGKNFRIFGIRQSLIGDSIMALPLLTLLEKMQPDSYKIWHIARKCSQSAQLYFNHPLIDKILITDCDEGFGQKDEEEMRKCDVRFNTTPPFHSSADWPNNYNIYEETALMAGFTLEQYNTLTDEEKRPKLIKWFNVEKQRPKTIALWPCAGYGNENKRNPSELFYLALIGGLSLYGYKIIQFGHPKDYNLQSLVNVCDQHVKDNFSVINHLSFFDQIKMTLGCDLVISTDSGSGLIFGAYEMPQISLLTNHFPNHTKNFTAFSPNNINNTNFIGIRSPDNIDVLKVLAKVKELCP